jgi:redox-sensitive bicupin YhaK (pirin superfamily)
MSIVSISLLAGGAAAQQPERFTLAGSDVAIYNLAGAVTVEPGTGSVTVQVTRGGAAAARLTVAQDEIDGRETLRVRYPGDRVVYGGLERGSSTELRVRDDGTFGDGDYHQTTTTTMTATPAARSRRSPRPHQWAGTVEAHADLRIQLPAGREVAIIWPQGLFTIDGRLHIDAHNAPVTATPPGRAERTSPAR